MASSSSRDCPVRRTRLQEANEKRMADEQLKQKTDLKRRKKMFLPRKVIGPRDIVVNSNLPKIKLEEDGGYSPLIKQERLEVRSTSVEDFSDIHEPIESSDNLVGNGIKTGKIMLVSHEDEKENDTLLTSLKSKENLENDVLQKHIKSLEILVAQKDQEIKVLVEAVERLRLHLCSVNQMSTDEKLEMNQSDEDDSSTHSQDTGILPVSPDKQVAQLTSNLTSKDNRIKMLTMMMIKLQNNLLDNPNNGLHVHVIKDSRSSEQIVQEYFKMILPILSHELKLKDILACRSVCHTWKNTIDTYLSSYSLMMPFNREMHLKIFHRLESGYIQGCKLSPLTKLAKCYTFSDLGMLEKFTDYQKGLIIGSTVCLNNIILNEQISNLHDSKLNSFLDCFGSKVMYIEIRQCIESSNFKIDLLMDRIKLCLRKLTNLRCLKIVFMIETEKIKAENGWRKLEDMGRATNINWQTSTFPKLENLESLIFDVEILEGWTVHANFLRNFSKSLINPYSKQLKQLSIFSHGIGPSEALIVPNLVQLTIPQRYLGLKAEFGCERVEKCTLTSCVYVLTHDVILIIKRLFPKLVSLGFRFEYAGGKFENLYWTPFAPQLQDLHILELENSGAVAFNVLSCFPNVRYLKLINKYSGNADNIKDVNVLNTTKLWQGSNPYESKIFWDQFPNISVVTLELSGDPMITVKPKICTWTRDGYSKYWKKYKFDDFLLSLL